MNALVPATTVARFSELMNVIGSLAGPAARQHASALGLAGPWSLLWLIQEQGPAPMAPADFHDRSPYSSRHLWDAPLAGYARDGLLVPAGPAGAVQLTDLGRERLGRMITFYEDELLALEPALLEGALDFLAATLARLVDASVAAGEPGAKRWLAGNRRSDPGADAPAFLRVVQSLSDLLAFRDDCHLAAWRPLGVSGPAWESLTLIWRREAATAEELAARLAPRQLGPDDYAAALAELAARGWIEADPPASGAFRVTAAGRAVRETAEATTDRYYYAPWSVLGAGEREALLGGLSDLLAALRARKSVAA